MLRSVLLGSIILALAGACCATEFKDVPKEHWAAESVKTLADAGVVKGYPDQTFKGDNHVTRYELAVALDGMIKFIQASFQPVTNTTGEAKPGDWAKSSAASLKAGGFLPPDSPVIKGDDKPVTAEELGAALAAVSARLIELRVPSDKPTAN